MPHNTGVRLSHALLNLLLLLPLLMNSVGFFLSLSVYLLCSLFMCIFGPKQKPEGTNLYPNTINSGSADGSKSARFSCSINSYIGEWFNYHCIYIYNVLWMY